MSASKIENTQYGFMWGPATVTRVCDCGKWGCVLQVSTARQRVDIRVTPSGIIRVEHFITRRNASNYFVGLTKMASK
jgi:hypothetical protein